MVRSLQVSPYHHFDTIVVSWSIQNGPEHHLMYTQGWEYQDSWGRCTQPCCSHFYNRCCKAPYSQQSCMDLFRKSFTRFVRKFNGFNFFTSRNERKLISSYKIVNYLVKGEKSKSKKKGIEVLSFEWLSIYGRHLCKLRINEWLWLEKLTCIAKIQNVDRGENW